MEFYTENKNCILQIHAKWLKDNGYFEEAKECSLQAKNYDQSRDCLLYTSPSPRDATLSRMPSSA